MDCPPPLVTFETSRLDFDGLTIIEGEADRGTYKLHVAYSDNRTSYDSEFESSGTWTLENRSLQKRRVQYRQSLKIRPGTRPVVSDDSPACWDGESLIVCLWEVIIDPGQTMETDISYKVRMVDRADLNGDGKVDSADQGLLFAAWGTADKMADLDGDGKVGGQDLGILQSRWDP